MVLELSWMGEAHSMPAHVIYPPQEAVLTEMEFIDPSMCLFKCISASLHFFLMWFDEVPVLLGLWGNQLAAPSVMSQEQ